MKKYIAPAVKVRQMQLTGNLLSESLPVEKEGTITDGSQIEAKESIWDGFGE